MVLAIVKARSRVMLIVSLVINFCRVDSEQPQRIARFRVELFEDSSHCTTALRKDSVLVSMYLNIKGLSYYVKINVKKSC